MGRENGTALRLSDEQNQLDKFDAYKLIQTSIHPCPGVNMLVEDQRFLHEDLERLEQGVTDRVAEDPRNVRSNQAQACEPVANIYLDQRQVESRSSNKPLPHSDT